VFGISAQPVSKAIKYCMIGKIMLAAMLIPSGLIFIAKNYCLSSINLIEAGTKLIFHQLSKAERRA